MFIKHLNIKRFKSYRELSLFNEPLSEQVNVVIGGNGNGKSNFLDAMIFVLTDKYSNMRSEDKKLLLHEEQGGSSSNDSREIVVDLVMDNKSKRFPADKDVVTITKTYNTQDNKEDITINSRRIMKPEVMNLLESAGFCKNNPYYIIQQGKIANLINMNEFELFEQFSEVTGTKVYEEKKTESLRLLDEAADNRKKIVKQSEEIDEYIKRLSEQTKDLERFEQLETKKKAVESFIFNEKLSHFSASCDLLQLGMEDLIRDIEARKARIQNSRLKISEKEMRITRAGKIIQNYEKKMQQAEEDLKMLNEHKSREEASEELRAMKDKSNQDIKEGLRTELIKLEKEIDINSTEKFRIKKKIADLDLEISKVLVTFNEFNLKSDALMIKGADAHFKSEAERKAYIAAEVKSLKESQEKVRNKIMKLDQEINNDKLIKNQIIGKITELDNKNKETSVSLTEITNHLISLKKERIEIVNQVKKNDLELNEFVEELEQNKEALKQNEKLIPNFEVLKAVSYIKSLNLPGVYGILMDFISVDQKYRNAVDLIAKDKLYAIVCDTLDTANKILEINKDKNGPVICIYPLDWNMNDKSFQYPKGTNEILPLISAIKIKSDINHGVSEKQLKPLFNKIFGKCVLTKNYELGIKFAKENHLNVVTAENEIIYAGGFVTKVGYYDYKRQRLDLYAEIDEINSNINSLNEKTSWYNSERVNYVNMETQNVRNTQDLFIKKGEITSSIKETEKEVLKLKDELNNLTDLISSNQQQASQLQTDFNSLDLKIRNYESLISEGKKKSQSQPRDTDLEEKITELNEIKAQNEKKMIEREKAKIGLNSQLQELNRLEEELKSRKENIENQLKDLYSKGIINASQIFDFNQGKEDLLGIERGLIEKEISNLDSKRLKFKNSIQDAENEINTLNTELTKEKEELSNLVEKLSQKEADLKEIALQLNDKNEKKSNLRKNLGNLGQIKKNYSEKFEILKEKQEKLLSNESHGDMREKEKYVNKLLEPFFQKLEKVNNKMKQFDKINRFALEDFKNFNNKKQEISDKLKDLEEKEHEIKEVIEVLDNKKDNAIQNTFDKVNNNFEYFFKELVPNGNANLTIEHVVNNSQHPQQQKKTEQKGIYINVSFSGRQNYQAMHLLSGGQKTAVAVALIFALSKIDPPPFYILDEIDAALDPSMRINLAKLIENLSKSNQFIISTFKPEILEVANNVYQAKFMNKESKLTRISKEEAKNFIKDSNN
jgi:structural maintenance of chromosome 3 (chondroitin sulfate proteoglycan 6)